MALHDLRWGIAVLEPTSDFAATIDIVGDPYELPLPPRNLPPDVASTS